MAFQGKSKQVKKTVIQLRDLSQFTLFLNQDQKNALAYEGTPVLIPTDNGLELRILKNGALLAPNILGAIGRAGGLLREVVDQKGKATEPRDLYIRSLKIIDANEAARAIGHLKDLETKLSRLKEWSLLLANYQSAEDIECRIKTFLTDVLIPDIRTACQKYWDDKEFLKRGFKEVFQENSLFGPSVLKLVNQKPNLGDGIFKLLFPKNPSQWLQVKPEFFATDLWPKAKKIVADGDGIEAFLKAIQIVDLADKQRQILQSSEKEDKHLYFVLPPDVSIKKTYPSRGGFSADWATLTTVHGNFQACNMGILTGSTLISGLRNGFPAGYFVEKVTGRNIKEYDHSADENIYRLKLPQKLDAAKSWGFFPEDVKAKDRVSEVLDGDKAADAVVYDSKFKDLDYDLTPEKKKEAQLNIPKIKEDDKGEFKAQSAYPLDINANGLLGENQDLTPNLKKKIGKFLRTIPGPLQIVYLNRFLAAAQGDLVYDESSQNVQSFD